MIWNGPRSAPAPGTLQAGTGDATLHPSPGACARNGDGTIGRPYTAAQAGDTPPCGLTYHRATHGTGSYPLTASLTWEVTWEGSSGSGGTLPDGIFETTHDITVEDVPAIIQ